MCVSSSVLHSCTSTFTLLLCVSQGIHAQQISASAPPDIEDLDDKSSGKKKEKTETKKEGKGENRIVYRMPMESAVIVFQNGECVEYACLCEK